MNPPLHILLPMKIATAIAAATLFIAVEPLPTSFSDRLTSRSMVERREKPREFGFRIALTHTDSDKNFTKMDMVRRAYRRDQNRLARLTTSSIATTAADDGRTRDFQARILAGSGEYLMNLSVGTPPVQFTAIVDTGSDLLWTQCMPCLTCNKSLPIFDPTRSSSFSNVSCVAPLCKALSTSNCTGTQSCEYTYSYNDASSTQGFLGSETFTFSGTGEAGVRQQASAPNVGFGCGVNNKGTGLDSGAGVIGLGRGPLSFITQLGTTKFSYCFASFGGNKASTLLVGSQSDPNSTTADQGKFTVLLRSALQPTFYYLSLEGITVGSTRLPIPKSLFQMGPDGSGGVVIDSGTSVTMLTEDAYEMVKMAFTTQMSLNASSGSGSDSEPKSGLDLCFHLGGKKVEEVEVPTLQFHFTGLDLLLPPENYMIADAAADMVCLAMGPSGPLSIFGNVQQQNMLVVYELQKQRVSFSATHCDQL